LIGKDYAGYGQFLNQNFVRLLENFSSATAQASPLVGQLWWDSGTVSLKVWNGTTWKEIAHSTASSNPPANATSGDLWFNENNNTLNVYNKAGAWITIGPTVLPTYTSGAFQGTLTDIAGVTHQVINFEINSVTYAVFAFERFTTAIPGFTNIYPGFNLNTQTGVPLQFSGVASSAHYADLAERFAADQVYEPGTVVELGGSAEIRQVEQELSENVFGVISTNVAYLMNSDAGNDATHPPVALSGRVPVKVTGTVVKGDRLVSAGFGLARAARPGEANSFNVIGRSLVDKPDPEIGKIEAIVRINT
jgi:hypothetical protein